MVKRLRTLQSYIGFVKLEELLFIRGRGRSGTGTDLYLVNQITKQFGRRAWMEENEPTEAVFKVEIPKYVEAA